MYAQLFQYVSLYISLGNSIYKTKTTTLSPTDGKQLHMIYETNERKLLDFWFYFPFYQNITIQLTVRAQHLRSPTTKNIFV